MDEVLGEKLGSFTPVASKRGTPCASSTPFSQLARSAPCFSSVQLPVVKPLGKTHPRCDNFLGKMRRTNAHEYCMRISVAVLRGRLFSKRGKMFERASTSHFSAALTKLRFLARLAMSVAVKRFAVSAAGR